MANVQHAALTGADLHEPKGAATATIGTVYVSNGSGSGSWSSIEGTAIKSTGEVSGAVLMADGLNASDWVVVEYPMLISAAVGTSAYTFFGCSPFNGTIERVYAVCDSNLTAGTGVVFSISGTPVTGLTFDLNTTAGSAATATATSLNSVSAGTVVKVDTEADAGLGGDANLVLTIVVKRTS